MFSLGSAAFGRASGAFGAFGAFAQDGSKRLKEAQKGSKGLKKALEKAVRVCPVPPGRPKRLFEPAPVPPPVRSKRLFETAVRDHHSKVLGSATLCSEPLYSALLCSVHVHARVHTSIYLYKRSRAGPQPLRALLALFQLSLLRLKTCKNTCKCCTGAIWRSKWPAPACSSAACALERAV